MALTDNLVAYYKLDESSGDAADEVGGFTLTNTGTTGYASALINNGADYGTANSTKYLRVANNLGITNGHITISTWVKMRTEIASGRQFIAIKGDATTNVNYMIFYEYNGGTRRLGFNRQRQAVSNNVRYMTATLGTSVFNHIALTYDGTNMYGYLNGVASSALAVSGDGSSAAVSQFKIGQDDGQYISVDYLSAYQDETGVWSRALSSTEIGELYNSGAGLAYPFGGGGAVNSGFFNLM